MAHAMIQDTIFVDVEFPSWHNLNNQFLWTLAIVTQQLRGQQLDKRLLQSTAKKVYRQTITSTTKSEFETAAKGAS
jgi:hypothetical protein